MSFENNPRTSAGYDPRYTSDILTARQYAALNNSKWQAKVVPHPIRTDWGDKENNLKETVSLDTSPYNGPSKLDKLSAEPKLV